MTKINKPITDIASDFGADIDNLLGTSNPGDDNISNDLDDLLLNTDDSLASDDDATDLGGYSADEAEELGFSIGIPEEDDLDSKPEVIDAHLAGLIDENIEKDDHDLGYGDIDY